MEGEGQAKVMIGTRNREGSVFISGYGSGAKSDGFSPPKYQRKQEMEARNRVRCRLA